MKDKILKRIQKLKNKRDWFIENNMPISAEMMEKSIISLVTKVRIVQDENGEIYTELVIKNNQEEQYGR